jgi:hypothetical protein
LGLLTQSRIAALTFDQSGHYVADRLGNIITLVCSGKTTGFPNEFPDKSVVIDYKHVFVVDLDKKLVDKHPAEVDEKSISYTWGGNNGETRLVNIDRVTGEASVSDSDNQWHREFSGICVISEGSKF